MFLHFLLVKLQFLVFRIPTVPIAHIAPLAFIAPAPRAPRNIQLVSQSDPMLSLLLLILDPHYDISPDKFS